ncbi:hypothetical protein JY651_09890 [Pyxidicoccus parkwayensis]|uniref:DUF4384 domain-containing protein n=1 Tax=Pyxidicoccus parkwayensis TaxID=2813578 RepID=A0ABX7P468_9BACT|nr:hypothetical protein [Pyxidicoccus parkwaysis]QSQ25212.1 hypothetical protein JY651_09890 [Pyxidicoccus parkwaysis]
MSEHLSDLVLDELALGGRPFPAHVDACARCRARLDRFRAEGAALRASEEFPRTLAQVLEGDSSAARVRELEGTKPATWERVVEGTTPATPARMRVGAKPSTPARSWFHWLRYLAPVAVAAGLSTVVLLREPDDGVRVKGGPFVSLVRQRDGAVDAPLQPGDVVTLSVHAAPHRYALVLVTDAAGTVSALWPARGDKSGDPSELPATPTFVVTPGNFTLDAYFSDAPLALAQVREGVASATVTCVARHQPPDCEPPSLVEGAARHHRLSVSVNSP